MSSRKLLTIFGATGNQGGGIIDVVLSHTQLASKYKLRGITRNTTSKHAQELQQKGVEMVQADLNDLESLKIAVRGSYGVYGVTNFWDKDVMNKEKEIRQGMNIFEACQAEDVKHLVFSTLPYAEKITNGELKHVDHFDGKAIVAEHIEANKGSMMASYLMPAMYINFAKDQVKTIDGVPTMGMPFPSDSFPWPILEPRADGGKYAMGLFEGGKNADGVKVHAVSVWTSPRELVTALSKTCGKKVAFQQITADDLRKSLPTDVADELTETQLLVGNYHYYGKGEDSNQAQHNRWLVDGATTTSLEEIVIRNGPWNF